MKSTHILAGALLAALPACSKETVVETVVIDQDYCLEFFSGEFHGERTQEDEYRNLYIMECEDITFGPYDSPREVTGVVNATVNGEATICDWCISNSDNYAMEPLTFTCYYSITYDTPITMYFCQYDPDTGLTTDSGIYVPSTLADDASFKMISYWRGRMGSYLTYSRR